MSQQELVDHDATGPKVLSLLRVRNERIARDSVGLVNAPQVNILALLPSFINGFELREALYRCAA